MIAASVGNYEITNMLINKQADVNHSNSTGQRPIHYAASKDRYKVVQFYQQYTINLKFFKGAISALLFTFGNIDPIRIHAPVHSNIIRPA